VVLIDPERLRQALIPLLGHDPPGRWLPFETFEFLVDEGGVKFTLEEKDFVLRLDTYDIRESPVADLSHAIPQRIPIPGEPDWPASRELLSPDGRWLLGFKDDNLLLRSTLDGSIIPLTSDGVEDHLWFPFPPGTWASWSPDGRSVVAQKLDWRGVPKVPVPCFTDGEDVRWEYYPTAGEPNGKTELHVLSIPDGRTVSIDLGYDTDLDYVFILGWQADGSRVFVARSHWYGTRAELLAADPATGDTQLLFEEDRKVDFRPQFTLLADGGFIRLSPGPWESDTRGTEQLYLHDIDGGLIRILTPDTLRAARVIEVDEATDWVYWRGRTKDPRADAHLYRVRLDGTGLTRLTEGVGYHDVELSPSKRFFIDNHSSTARPPSAELRSVEGVLLQTLSTADITDLEALGWSPPESFVVKAADGITDIFGGIYKPNDFDPEKKYPVIQTIYAAPFSEDAQRGFSRSPQQGRALAQLGFITVRNDWRGSFSWGTPQQPIYGNIGRYEVADYMAVLRQLAAERPYMDLSRVGIFGGSYGGYMTIRAMLQAPDFYTVGVATSPFTDIAKHYGNDGYIGPLETNREAYEYASNIAIAGNLRGKLLLIHGTCDALVLHTMRIIEEFARTGRPYDLILLPGEGHGLSVGKNRQYWLDAIRRYFVEHLKP
jgi:dipeptidyl aminopeptidase/acylaminoacyl peptidase